MKFSLFNGNWDLSHKVAIVSCCANVILGATVLVQSWGLATKRERVILAPPTIDQVYQIQYDSANTAYYESFAVVIAGIIGQTTPQNVDNTIKTLNQFLSPALQRQMSESLSALVAKLPKSNFTSWFVPRESSYEKQTGKLFISGNLHSSLTGSNVQAKPVVYEFIIKMQSGKPIVTFFDSYEGSKPRTLSLLRKQEKAEAQAQAKGIAAK